VNQLGQVRLLWARSLREGLRNPALAYAIPVVIPLGLLVLVSATLSRVTDLPGFPSHNYAYWLTPGVIMLAAMSGVGYAATSLVIDLQSGFLDRLRLLETRPTTLLASRVLFDIARVVPAGVALLVVGRLFGADVNEGVVGVAGLLALLTLWAAGYGGLFFVVALYTRNAQAPLALAPLFMPLSFLSTLYVPSPVLPGWVRATTRWNPFTYMVEAARALTTGPFHAAPVAKGFALAAALVVVTQAASLAAFKRAVSPP
jgi:ABC-2 type transport system permease protein